MFTFIPFLLKRRILSFPFSILYKKGEDTMKTFQEVFFENFEQLFQTNQFFTPVLIKKDNAHGIEHHLISIQYNQFFTALIVDIQFEPNFHRMSVELHQLTSSGSMYYPFSSFSFVYTEGEKYKECLEEISYFLNDCKRDLSFDF
jgi:hypothetical protein